LSATRRQFVLVATKSDRLSGNQLRNALQTLSREYPEARIVPYSAKTGAGRDDLWRELRSVASPLSSEATSTRDSISSDQTQ
jgi:selenocysteine-specific translation elongation factor